MFGRRSEQLVFYLTRDDKQSQWLMKKLAQDGVRMKSRDTDLAVAEATLRLDERDDLEAAHVDLQKLVRVAGHGLRRAPRAAVRLLPDPVSRKIVKLYLLSSS